MPDKTKPIPEGYHSVTPYLIVNDAAGAIAFYEKAFGATESMRIATHNGKVGHAEIVIGDSRIMLADEYPDMDCRGPQAYGGSPVGLYLLVVPWDAHTAQAKPR